MLSYAILCYPMPPYAILCYPVLSYPMLSHPIHQERQEHQGAIDTSASREKKKSRSRRSYVNINDLDK